MDNKHGERFLIQNSSRKADVQNNQFDKPEEKTNANVSWSWSKNFLSHTLCNSSKTQSPPPLAT
jgi:hypothetical protein